MTSRHRKAASLPAMWTELMFAAPQVVAHRLTRMALAGAAPSGRDRKEFDRMLAEKNAAFLSSWQSMGRQVASVAIRSWFAAASGRPKASADVWRDAGAALLRSGLAPVHRTAVANARRLAKTRLR